jgi:hypothetical protein
MRLLVPESAGLPTLKKFNQDNSFAKDNEPKEVEIYLVDPVPSVKLMLQNCNGGIAPIFEEVPSETDQ